MEVVEEEEEVNVMGVVGEVLEVAVLEVVVASP